MVETKDKAGQTIYITWTDDCEPNEGGFYCETYSDDFCDNKIDDFCIYPNDDIPGWSEMSWQEQEDAVEEYCMHYYDDEVLDLNWVF